MIGNVGRRMAFTSLANNCMTVRLKFAWSGCGPTLLEDCAFSIVEMDRSDVGQASALPSCIARLPASGNPGHELAR